MPRPRLRSSRRFQFDSFDVLIGPERAGRFNSDEEWQSTVDAMAAWYRVHGEQFERDFRYAGARSWAWWMFVRGEEPPPPAEEFTRLQELGEISVEEELDWIRETTKGEQCNEQ